MVVRYSRAIMTGPSHLENNNAIFLMTNLCLLFANNWCWNENGDKEQWSQHSGVSTPNHLYMELNVKVQSASSHCMIRQLIG